MDALTLADELTVKEDNMPLAIGAIMSAVGALGQSGGGAQAGGGGIGSVIGQVAGLVGGLLGNKPVHWHVYEFVNGGATDKYITEVSQPVWEALRAQAPLAPVDAGVTFRNLKLPKNIADQFRLELTSQGGPVPYIPSQYGPANIGDTLPPTIGVIDPITGQTTYIPAPTSQSSAVPIWVWLIGGFLLIKTLK